MLLYMEDSYTDLKEGDIGTIQYQDDAGTIHVRWDNGSELGLIPGIDKYIILTLKEERKLKLKNLNK